LSIFTIFTVEKAVFFNKQVGLNGDLSRAGSGQREKKALL
jgi:hypothetical protein